jgi:hypothetical protein
MRTAVRPPDAAVPAIAAGGRTAALVPYQSSVAVAQVNLLPALRAEPPGTVVLADGFSCRTPGRATRRRPARHLAELWLQALQTRDQPAGLP